MNQSSNVFEILFSRNTICTSLSRKLNAVTQDIYSNARNKVATNKSWFVFKFKELSCQSLHFLFTFFQIIFKFISKLISWLLLTSRITLNGLSPVWLMRWILILESFRKILSHPGWVHRYMYTHLWGLIEGFFKNMGG